MMTRGRRRRDGWEGGPRQRSGCGSRSLFNGRLKKTQSPKPRQAWDGVFSGDPRLLGVIWELAGALGVAGERRLTVECRGWFSGRSRGCENVRTSSLRPGGGVEGVHHQVPSMPWLLDSILPTRHKARPGPRCAPAAGGREAITARAGPPQPARRPPARAAVAAEWTSPRRPARGCSAEVGTSPWGEPCSGA